MLIFAKSLPIGSVSKATNSVVYMLVCLGLIFGPSNFSHNINHYGFNWCQYSVEQQSFLKFYKIEPTEKYNVTDNRTTM
jgi:hypothetical protein